MTASDVDQNEMEGTNQVRTIILAAAAFALSGGAIADEELTQADVDAMREEVMISMAGTVFTIDCGAMEGQVYYAPGGVVPKEKEGWQPEDFSSHRGKTTFTIQPDGSVKHTLSYRDGSGLWTTVGLDGQSITHLLDFDLLEGRAMVMAAFSSSMATTQETYLYVDIFGVEGPTELIYVQGRSGPITSGKLNTAPCQTTVETPQ